MPRGGKRPGAGAPEGNFNALKHGKRSAQLRQLFAAAAQRTDARRSIRRLLDGALLTAAGLVRKRKGS